MEQVNHEFLAELAKSNSPVLNSKPLQDGDYDIEFDYMGFHFEFSQKNGYWQWKYSAK